ncbi:MAG: hypothetical protein DCF26_15735 [Burkholderiales bacterium]|nr:MAG: hypothetical protein DCF26_15735 [Burkholderiales bacterium]
MMSIQHLYRTALVAAVLCASGVTSAQAALVGTYEGNDCSGVFGQGFSNCSYNGSPVIAKFDVNGQGTGGSWTINSALFPTVTGNEWTFGFGSTGSWTYTPGAGDPLITFYVAKGGNGFNLFSNDGDVNSGDWFTPLNNGGNRAGLSHITFYDTGRPSTQVPEPVSLALLGLGLLGVGAVRRRTKP